MKRQQVPSTSKGSAAVSLSHGSVIICRLNGHITGHVVQNSMRQTKEYADLVRAGGKQPRLLIDIGGVTGQTSEARREAKQLNSFGIERIAVAGGGRSLTMVGRYIARAGGLGDYTRFFRTEKGARQWLDDSEKHHRTDEGAILRRVIAALVICISVSVLIGWAIDSRPLKSWLPGANTMNPMNAVNFILMAGVLLLLRKERMSTSSKVIAGIAAVWFMFWGVIIILRNAFGWDAPIDRLLFESKLQISQGVAPNASFDYLLLGGMVLAVLGGMRKLWQRYVFHSFSFLLFVTTLGALFGMSFGLEQLYSGNFVPMALNTAIVFLLFNHAMQTVNIPLPFFKRFFETLNKYWQPIVVLTAVLFVVGLAWQQSRQEVQRAHDTAVQEEFRKAKTAITDRFDTYTNVLRGYKGFVESSEFVSASEYRNFFLNSQPADGYPGFSAISFIRYIPRSSEAQFIADMKRQAGIIPAYGKYAITPNSSNDPRYPLTFVEPHTPTTNWGFDLGTSEPRRVTLESARDTGEPTASGSIDLNASNPDPNRPNRTGFFMTIPIYKGDGSPVLPKTIEERRLTIYGFINTIFENDQIFPDIFKYADKRVKLVVANAKDAGELHVQEAESKEFISHPTLEDEVIVGGQHWKLSMYAPPQFGSDGLARILPNLILGGGGLLALLAFAFLMSQMRRRDQAMRLADDMTEDLKKERNEAVVARQKDEAILASIGDAVFAVDTDGRILLFNSAAQMISGYTNEEAVGRHYKDILRFVYEKDHKPNDAFIKKALSGHLAQMKNHTKLIRKDGSEVFVADSAAPIKDHEGSVVGAIIVFRDVSKEQELDRAKTEFVSLASHQLRTPLSAINWYGELLLNGDAGKLTQDQKQYVQEIYDGNQRMIELVNSLLDVSRLDLGKLSNQPVPTSIGGLIESIEKELAIMINEKSLVVTNQLQAGLSPVAADPKLLRMIVQNLLSNATKYTAKKGIVEVVLRQADAGDMHAARLTGSPEHHMFMSVRDNGYGIPKAQQNKIFDKLFRADNVRGLDVEGTGLGLYIVKEVTEKLGGRVWFESAESIGTTFFVVLPFRTKASQVTTIEESKAKNN